MARILMSCSVAATIALFLTSSVIAATSTPLAPPNVCISHDATQNCATLSNTSQVKWHPGHYMMCNGFMHAGQAGGSAGPFSADYSKLSSSGSNVVGYMLYYDWGAIETSQGVYNFSAMDQDIATLSAMSPPKRLSIMVSWYTTSSGVTNGQLPTYLVSNVAAYGAGADGVHSGYWTFSGSTSGSATVALWRPAVMARYIALMQAIAARYDSNPYFESIHLPETSGVVVTAAPDYSDNALLTQYESLISASVAAFAHTNVAIQNNYMQGAANTAALTTYAQQNRAGIGGPDTWGASAVTNYGASKGYTWGQEDLLGISGQSGYTADLRGTMPSMTMVEEPDIDGTQFTNIGSPFAPQDIFNQASGALHASHIFWVNLGPTGTGYYSANPTAGNWPSVLSAINANPILYTACPSNYKQGCNTN